MRILTILCAFALTGCGPNAAETVTALGQDHAGVSITIVTPWGTQHIARVNPTTQQSATVAPDGTITIGAGK